MGNEAGPWAEARHECSEWGHGQYKTMKQTEYAPGVRYEMINDGRGLRIEKDTAKGTTVSTHRWTEKATPDLVEAALKLSLSDGAEMHEVGERLRMRRIGPVGVTLDTGPPTWWWPHIGVKFGSRWVLRAGWLRGCVEIWKYEEKE